MRNINPLLLYCQRRLQAKQPTLSDKVLVTVMGIQLLNPVQSETTKKI
jgi:hypothetical protein